MFSKCKFYLDFVTFPKHVVSMEGIIVDQTKLEAIHSSDRPMTVTEIWSFVRLASYYRRLIDGFLTIAFPLTCLT